MEGQSQPLRGVSKGLEAASGLGESYTGVRVELGIVDVTDNVLDGLDVTIPELLSVHELGERRLQYAPTS